MSYEMWMLNPTVIKFNNNKPSGLSCQLFVSNRRCLKDVENGYNTER